MKTIFIPLFILMGLVICEKQVPHEKSKKVVYIQPLGDVKPEYLNSVTESISSFYGYRCIVNPKTEFTSDVLSLSGRRYDANKILKKYRSNNNILIITEKDITTKKGDNPEWGVLGLGYRPGKTCVVSTFRMKNGVTSSKIKERLEKVALHEVGHNLGLDHCSNDIHCMMNDAKGTISQIDKERVYLCNKCKNQIGMR
jgi:archaemetzincin